MARKGQLGEAPVPRWACKQGGDPAALPPALRRAARTSCVHVSVAGMARGARPPAPLLSRAAAYEAGSVGAAATAAAPPLSFAVPCRRVAELHGGADWRGQGGAQAQERVPPASPARAGGLAPASGSWRRPSVHPVRLSLAAFDGYLLCRLCRALGGAKAGTQPSRPVSPARVLACLPACRMVSALASCAHPLAAPHRCRQGVPHCRVFLALAGLSPMLLVSCGLAESDACGRNRCSHARLRWTPNGQAYSLRPAGSISIWIAPASVSASSQDNSTP